MLYKYAGTTPKMPAFMPPRELDKIMIICYAYSRAIKFEI